ncbi:FAD-dependent oxidoreductase [Pseudoalteromonas denitrificans]|uniref:FAD dependent oxidoreductase n=1 Tax=Pseudoalteromonas denitrificans DSM 6059 TaxID=1123010 RepID=A0A1I1LV47_9GAMM|nr:FAD-dependent oxidoreductase [Pseudoalteromonas denitrificans]SFC74183.1 FAD dependent oxidoreductase [Pseudoalteromonas denitrificans DSM 6059]
MPDNHQLNSQPESPHIGIIGGGIAGSTIALRLAELGIKVTLIEKGSSLVNGPPICHLHAGGNLYREISEQQCLTLLRQSIDTLKVYKHSANIRPTVIALPQHDKSQPEDLIPRLNILQAEYQQLIEQDSSNQVLGPSDNYFRLYSKSKLIKLAKKALPLKAQNSDDWMIPVAKNLDFDTVKFPLILVQEYGLSAFRLAATTILATDKLNTCQVLTNTKAINITKTKNSWKIKTNNMNSPIIAVDYLVNACGFKTGEIDDMLMLKRHRMVEFKAAYITHWHECKGQWPEVIVHGERGTPQGMAQLTPYANGYFQLHGMTQDITLFKDGLVSTSETSAQPQLEQKFINKIDNAWQAQNVFARTKKSIEHMTQFIPKFCSAQMGGNPLFGAQQIPGNDPDLRAADVTFNDNNYARAEIVKASSALDSANLIINKLIEKGLIQLNKSDIKLQFSVTHSLTQAEVTKKALSLAKQRNYPTDLAKVTNT